MELTARSISKAIQEVYECRDQLIEAVEQLIRQLTEQGTQIAKIQVASMEAVDTDELEQSIYGYYDPQSRIGYVIAGAAHAFYVEYGTGPIGEASPHPEPDRVGWEYNIGPTIHLNEKHPEWGVGWYYPGDDGKWHWTQGQPSRPFMYNTFVWLEEAAESLGRNILT